MNLSPYYHKKNFRLYLGDCIKTMEYFPSGSFDMVFADPPYFLSSGSFTCQNGRMVSVKKGDGDLGNGLDQNFQFHNNGINACKRILKPNGTIGISGTYHSIYQCGYALEKSNFHILNDISGFKPNASPNLSCRFFTASHETLLGARKDKKAKHTFNYSTVKNWENNYQKVFQCSHNKNLIEKVELLHDKGKQMRSVWAINTPAPGEKKFGKHPTQKPIELLKLIISSSTNPGDLILDPFTGSSTTGLAAIQLNRKFIGIDTEKKYLDLSIKRFEDFKNN